MKRVAFFSAFFVLMAAFGLNPFSGGKLSALQPVQVLVVEQLPGMVKVDRFYGSNARRTAESLEAAMDLLGF